MSEVADDIKATSASIAVDAARLGDLEEAKGTLAPDDPRLPGLSAEAEQLARQMAYKTALETNLVERAEAGE